MSIENRNLVESMASTCLSSTRESMNGSSLALLSSGEIKTSFLKFGITAISTPWPDGGASMLTESLRSTADALKFDRDLNVSYTAYMALNVCNVATTHRSPPLIILTRTVNEPDRNKISFSKEILEADMAAVNEDILKSKFTEEQTKKGKTKKHEKKKETKDGEVQIKVSADETKDTQNEEEATAFLRKDTMERTESDLGVEKISDDPKSGHDGNNKKEPMNDIGRDEVDIEPTADSIKDNDSSEQEDSADNHELDAESDLNNRKNDQFSNSDDDDMEDFPEIIDCGPDEEDR